MILECFEYNQHFVAMMNVINHARIANTDGKFYKHHIIPRCFYRKKGLEIDNSESNLVNLTYEEHRKVHQLAMFCAKDFMYNSMRYAYNRMCNIQNSIGYKHNEETKKKISNSMQGNQSAKGHKVSDETRKKIGIAASKRNKGKTPWNKGKTICKDSVDKMRKSKLAKHLHWYTNGETNILSNECPKGFYKGKI